MATKCHSERKLKDFAKESAKFQMRDEDNVILYYRQFIVLSQPLLDTQRLMAGARDKIFWCGFHKKNRLELQTRLAAEHTRQPLDKYFNYLDVYEVAMAILGTEESDSNSNDSSDDSRSPKYRYSGRPQEYQHDSDKHNSRIKEHRRASSPNLYHQGRDSHQLPPPETKTRVIRFKDSMWEEEGCKIDDLIRRMRGLSVQDKAYATLYGRYARWWPTVTQTLSKPQIVDHMPTPLMTFAVQTPALPPLTLLPAPQSWSAPTSSLPAPSSSHPPSFFCSSARSDSYAFCQQSGHRIQACPSTQEYVCTGHALVLEDQLSLPNGQPIPNDSAGHGLKHGIDTWLAAQSPIILATVSFIREVPPHVPSKHAH